MKNPIYHLGEVDRRQKEMKIRFLVIVSMVLLAFLPVKKLVYIEKDSQGSLSLKYDTAQRKINLFIDKELVANEKVREGIKLYIGSFFIWKHKAKLRENFRHIYKTSLEQFARQH